ncbi:DUF418 domain-containing protein [Streptomyces sp. SID8366]|uniref:DUF418 domain-containing protein n=1 Tax=unclassified Streptomyces TaxID=2593676 RepID=UPI000DB96FC3|nr:MULTISPECIES: DUF418 domain-containing protein [unclassified Streptomyces]MYU05726.1 DUF418 domain-containing protein [Streptomyces sp. SID8366]MYU65820.1 DUF418 domain-containing protein [Streptomyces sp. SID69]
MARKAPARRATPASASASASARRPTPAPAALPAPPGRVPPAPDRARLPAPAPARSGRVPAGRLVGIDLARGLAVFGMFSVHVGPDPAVGGPVGFLLETASGRSSALFALLAGFSLVIITGRPRPRTGRAGRQAVVTVVIRAVVLLVLGYALSALGTEVNVILSYYGVLFLAVLPLYRLRAGPLALAAGAAALVLPQALYGIRTAIADGGWADAVTAHDPLALLTGTDGTLDLLFTGDYPVLTWLPFLLAGMAVARLDLGRPHTASRLALTGGALALLGYGGSWLALRLVPHARSAVAAATHRPASSPWWWSDTAGEPAGRPPPGWLLVAVPHSETTFSIAGGTGVAVAVVAGCLTVAARAPRLTRAAGPVAAVGMMALTSYVLHILALWFFDDVWYVPGVDGDGMSALTVLAAFIAATMLLATVWTRLFRRGPMEQLLHLLTRPARSVG